MVLTENERNLLEVLEPAEGGTLQRERLKRACHPNHLVPLGFLASIAAAERLGLIEDDKLTPGGQRALQQLRDRLDPL